MSLVGAISVLIGAVVVMSSRSVLARVNSAHEAPVVEAQNVALGGEALA